jgi:hypothetical protein
VLGGGCSAPQARFASLNALAVLTSSVALADSQIVDKHVVGVFTGDTMTLFDRDKRQRVVRTEGVDAPETRQPFGDRSQLHVAFTASDRVARRERHRCDRHRGVRPARRWAAHPTLESSGFAPAWRGGIATAPTGRGAWSARVTGSPSRRLLPGKQADGVIRRRSRRGKSRDGRVASA